MVSVRFFTTILVCLLVAAPAAAQQPAPQQRNLVDLLNSGQWRFEQISQNHYRLIGDVDIEPSPGMRFTADVVDLYTDKNLLVASGNVVFTNPEGRLAAERVEFDIGTGKGTFHQASGIMSLGPTVDRAQFGNQDPDVYFYGDTIEKVSARQYKITRGGFSTCVQPTPRWEVVSKSVTINLDDYAIARNTVLRVKGVPLVYLPILYYPIQDDERATGFLMPTYGASVVRGQSLSNAFFWAIGRSQDATFYHDWYSRAGQGVGAEYRYQSNLSSYGSVRAYRFGQQDVTYTQNNGEPGHLPASTSYRAQASLVQTLGRRLRARARVDYFTDIVSQQIYQQNVAYSTQPYRVVEGGLSATLGPLSTSVQYTRNEVFSSPTRSSVYGSTPRVTANLAPRTLFGRQIYGSMNNEYAFLPNLRRREDITIDNSLGRAEFAPTLRVPMSRLTYLSVNTSASYRTTYYSRSLSDPDPGGDQQLIARGLIRQFMTVSSDIVGPVLTKIWDTPESDVTERMKHVIEPSFTVDYVTELDNQALVPQTSDVSDFVVGGAASFTYGLTNRLFYRSRPRDGQRSTTREFVTIGVQQTYYTDPLAAQYDSSYQGPRQIEKSVELSPVALIARFTPSSRIDATSRVEYDVSGEGLQIFTATGRAELFDTRGDGPDGRNAPGARSLTANLTYGRTRYRRESEANKYLAISTTSSWFGNRLGASYGLSWNISTGYIQSQSVMASYMAQCCGVQADFQVSNFPPDSPYPSDRRFNFSFVLAGLGTFTNFFGAFGQR